MEELVEDEFGTLDGARYVKIEGVWNADYWWKAALDNRKQFQVFPDDILLCSLPKSGITWTKCVVTAILDEAHGTRELETMDVYELVPTFDYSSPQGVLPFTARIQELTRQRNEWKRTRIYNSHFPLHCLPQDILKKGCKIIYVLRNPKDVVVSTVKFFEEGARQGQQWGHKSLQAHVDDLVAGRSMFGPHHLHLQEAWERRHQENMLILHYEDMLADQPAFVKKVAEFIGKPFENEQVYGKIAEKCGIDRLRSLYGFSERIGFDQKLLFRKGIVGDWRNVLSEEQSRQIDHYVGEFIYPMGIAFKD